MFSKQKQIVSSEDFDLEGFIQGTDVFNSKIIYMLPKLPSIGTYRIDLNEYRIDLISIDIYDTSELSEILLIYNGLTINQLKKGTEIKVPHIRDVRNLFRNIVSITNPVEYLKSAAEGNNR